MHLPTNRCTERAVCLTSISSRDTVKYGSVELDDDDENCCCLIPLNESVKSGSDTKICHLIQIFFTREESGHFFDCSEADFCLIVAVLKVQVRFQYGFKMMDFFPIKLEPRHMGGSRGRLITIPASLSDYRRRFSRSVDLGNKIKWEWIIILKPKNRCFHIVHDIFSHLNRFWRLLNDVFSMNSRLIDAYTYVKY